MTRSFTDRQAIARQSAERVALCAGPVDPRHSRPSRKVYGLNVSADPISRVTDAVLAEVSDWQNRAMEPMYLIHCRAAFACKR
jgi:transposase-like protein